MFGLPSQVPQQVPVGRKRAASDNAMTETDLDLEWAGAIAPNASLTYINRA
jgi:subtilase family serine protease